MLKGHEVQTLHEQTRSAVVCRESDTRAGCKAQPTTTVARYKSITATSVTRATVATIVTDMQKVAEMRLSEAPYVLVKESVKPLLEVYPDAVSATAITRETLTGNKYNRIRVEMKNGKSSTLHLYSQDGKKQGLLFDKGHKFDIKNLTVGFCKSEDTIITDEMIDGGQTYKVARLYAVL